METTRLVLDSDVLIDHLRRKTDAVRIALVSYNCAITAINLYELRSVPFLSVRQRVSLMQVLTLTDVLPFDEDAAEQAAHVWTLLRSQGQLIGLPDTQIAGGCLANQLPLLTRNLGHYQRVPNLQLLSPQDI